MTWSFQFLLLLCNVLLHRTVSLNANREYYKSLEKHIDTTVDPCIDFYLHACGNWQQVHSNESYLETLSQIDYHTNLELINVLADLQGKQKSRMKVPQLNYKFVKSALDFYRSCNEIDEYDPLMYVVWMEVYEGVRWPSLKRRKVKAGGKRQQYDWVKLLAQLRKYQLNGIFIEELVLQSLEHVEGLRIDIDKPVTNGGFLALNHQMWDIILTPLNIKDRKVEMNQLWKNVVEFEQKLQQLIEQHVEFEEIISTNLTSLQPAWLQRYVSLLLEERNKSNVTITVNNLGYMYDLEQLLANTDAEFITSYLQIRFVWHLLLSSPFDFSSKLGCMAHLRNMLPLAMNWLYEQDKPDLLKQSQAVFDIFEELKTKFHIILHKHAPRFPLETANILFEKLDNMSLKVNNLPRPNTAEHLEDYYKELIINPRDYYSNHLSALKFRFTKMHDQLFKPLTHNPKAYVFEESVESDIDIAPFYVSRVNTVIVPLSLLQRPVYDAHLNDIYKYSALGFLLAHELMHGFDETSLQHDKNKDNQSILEDVLGNVIIERNMKCLRRDHSNVLDEKIADINGLQLAYQTFFDGILRPNDTLAVMGIDSEYNKQQLFFLNFAQFFCGKKNAEDQLDFAHHGSDHQRVNDALANFDAFGKTYKCRKGSKMRHMHKCRLWR